MNPRHSMQGRRLLFKEIGGRRRFLYLWFLIAGSAFGVAMDVAEAVGRHNPKTYITQEEFWRHRANSLEKRMEQERERLIELRSKTRLTEDDVRAMLQICWRESRFYPGMKNPHSTSHGLFGFLRSTCDAYGPCDGDPVRQAQMALDYVNDRYGSPQRALDFHRKNGWY